MHTDRGGDIEAYEAVRDVSNSWSERMKNDKASVHEGVDALQVLNHKYTDAMREIMFERGGDVCLSDVSELHQITCPTLVIHGSKDVICYEHHARYISKHLIIVLELSLMRLAAGSLSGI